MAPLPDISGHFPIKNGFCYPDWTAITEVIEGAFPEAERNAAWKVATREWGSRLRDQLGGGYQVHETANFLIVSEAPPSVIKEACRSFEDALKRILTSLPGVAAAEGYGTHVVLMFASVDDYYRYIAHFFPEGEHPMSGGVCIYEGYVHFAFPTTHY